MLVLGVLACGGPSDDAPDEAADRIALSAPLAFELAPGAALVLKDAEVAGVGRGTVIVEALAVDASAGAIEELVLAEGPTALRLSGRGGSRRVAAMRAPELAADAHAVAAQVEGLTLGGFEDAWLVDERGHRTALEEPLVVDAEGLAWTMGELVVIELDDDESSAGAGAAGASPAGMRRVGIVGGAGVPDELAHARRGDGEGPWHPVGDALVHEGEPVALEPGDPCTTTSECPVETRCVADPTQSDGMTRCLALCTEPELVGGPANPVPSPTATCIDDAGCCDPSLSCDEGRCVVQEPDDPDPPSSGGGCDRDDDGWVNACDPRPDESCTHDADDDGCNDSFDSNDDDPCECAIPRLPRPNATGWALIALAWLRGRQRKR
jgi:hypothetical protein